jgi:hypothetical protein
MIFFRGRIYNFHDYFALTVMKRISYKVIKKHIRIDKTGYDFVFPLPLRGISPMGERTTSDQKKGSL